MRPAIPFAAAALLLGTGSAGAQSCGISASAAAFGTYSPLAAQPADTTASVAVTCQAAVQVLVSYSLALSPGQGSGFGTRVLRSGQDALSYQFYSNAQRTAVWGDGTGGTLTVAGGYLLSALVPVKQTQTAYARLPAGQNVAPGAYTDTVMITVWW